ncbi:uncharacterized protein BO66DRAFT_152784 [Aspergillus aculeatinus CBS 121060]|uniref:Uncharacterized protein n=1 Tax=Aspergillus aculeatinus CBS 121060 TaxID=1448322 RepID=A0ACD1H1M4_9EURO|nr:hypothetical protein BO66DRAFT_152784 [Aspergillus aculeatinus CBS 121060]RAH67511.1 hypothetical protein BO66DRAFT_152784 [Aspergillus aculeatinus CBS 121060]
MMLGSIRIARRLRGPEGDRSRRFRLSSHHYAGLGDWRQKARKITGERRQRSGVVFSCTGSWWSAKFVEIHMLMLDGTGTVRYLNCLVDDSLKTYRARQSCQSHQRRRGVKPSHGLMNWVGMLY